MFYNNDCSKFIPSDEYQAVFTCPPYYNTEIYNGKKFKNEEDYEKWWELTIKNSVKDSTKYFAFIINNEFKEVTKNICIKNGLILVEETPLSIKYNHFQRGVIKTYKGEHLMVFK